MNTRAYLAEFLGTFYLCFAGIAAILSNTESVGGGVGIVGIALAHGLALSIAVSVFGGISGAHFNPAVTIGMFATRRIRAEAAVAYILSQLAGGITAAAICRAVFPAAAIAETKLGIPLPGSWVTGQPASNVVAVVLVAEFVLTFLLITSIFGTAIDERGKAVKIGGFGIGLTVTFDILAGGLLTGASMNPARSFGPALILFHWDYHWCYWLAPLAGGCAAALLYHHVILPEEKTS